MRIAFVGQMSDKLMEKVMSPFEIIKEIEEVALFRRDPVAGTGKKVIWQRIPDSIRKNKNLAEIWKFVLLLTRIYKYDLVIGCFQQYHGLWAWIAGRLFGKPVIQYVITDVKWNYERFIPRVVMMHSDACAVMGPTLKGKLFTYGYHNKIEPVRLPISIPEITYLKKDTKYDLVAVGAFVEEKDYPWMMQVLDIVKQNKPDFKMAVRAAGDNTELVSLIKKHRLENNIELIGYLTEEELSTLYFSSRMLLLTSKVEGLTTVVLEAMSHSLPAIVTAVGDLPWLVRDGVDGAVIEHGKTEEMADSILKLLSDEEKLSEMGKNAKQRMLDLMPLFTVEKIAENWEKLINSVTLK